MLRSFLENNVKALVPGFAGCLIDDIYWIGPKRVMLVETRLRGQALNRGTNCQNKQFAQGPPRVTDWVTMKNDMQVKFLPKIYYADRA